MSRHRCPSWCHECPVLGGDVMAGCMGGAVYNDVDRCTCRRSGELVESEVEELRRRVEVLEAAEQKRANRRISCDQAHPTMSVYHPDGHLASELER